MNANPKILIGTLYSGENEFADCKRSLNYQEYRNWDQFVVSNEPNFKAHCKLYDTFMSNAREYDLFLKLDADMVLESTAALNTIIKIFHQNRDVDHIEMAVYDWFSDSLIMGLHAATNRAFWNRPADPVFVDPHPEVPGKHLRIYGAPAPVAAHSPDPSPFQGYHYGIHKAIKIVQKGSAERKIAYSVAHTGILLKVWKHFCKTGDRRLGLCLLGAEDYFTGEVKPEEYNYNNPVLKQRFSSYENLNAEQLFAMLRPDWGSIFSRRRNEYRRLKFKGMSMRLMPSSRRME